MAVEMAEAEVEAEVEAADVETVSNGSKQVVMAVNGLKQW
jgi:hypothetical protein